MKRFLYDTAVFAYAFGREHRYREPCRRIVEMAGREEIRGEASADMVQELLHQRYRSTGDRALAARQAREAAALCLLHEVRPEDVLRATSQFAATSQLGARDAVFVALALNRGIELILSPDKAFDEAAAIERVDPEDEAGVARLVASQR